MANSFDITRLTEVRAKMGRREAVEILPSSQPLSQEHSMMIPSIITTTISQDTACASSLSSPLFKRGDYELYKEKQQRQQQLQQSPRFHFEEDDSSRCDSSSCASSQTPTPCMVREEQQKVLSLESELCCVRACRQRIREQDIEMDALYAQLTKTKRLVGDLRHSRGTLIEDLLCAALTKQQQQQQRNHGTITGDSTSFDPSFGWSSNTILKLAMIVGLVIRLMDGSPHCLAIAVFGWWLTESFA